LRGSKSSLLVAALWAVTGCGPGSSSGQHGGGGTGAPGSGSGGSADGTGGGGPGSGGVPASSGGVPGSGGLGAGSGGAVGSGGRASGGVAGQGGAGGRAAGSGGRSGSGGLTAASGGVMGASGGAAGGTTGGGAGGAQPYKGVANSPCNDQATFKIAWYYNWTTTPEKDCTVAEFVPMVAGKSEKTTAAVSSALTGIAKAGYRTVLGFNEPNKSDQANLTVDQVVALWPTLTANADIRVGSPVTSADSNGQSWFTSFMGDVTTNALRVDFVALHWYGWNAGSCDAKATNLESYIKWAEGAAGDRPLWLTEWGCTNESNPDAATVQAFYQGALAMFAKHPRLERYAWYPWNTNNELVDSNDALTALGTVFSNAPAAR